MRGIFNGRERSFRSKPVRWSGPFVRVWFEVNDVIHHPPSSTRTSVLWFIRPMVRSSVREVR